MKTWSARLVLNHFAGLTDLNYQSTSLFLAFFFFYEHFNLEASQALQFSGSRPYWTDLEICRKKETVNYGLKPFCFRAFTKLGLLLELGCISKGWKTLVCRHGRLSVWSHTYCRTDLPVCCSLPCTFDVLAFFLCSLAAFCCNWKNSSACRCGAKSGLKFKCFAWKREKMQPPSRLFK